MMKIVKMGFHKALATWRRQRGEPIIAAILMSRAESEAFMAKINDATKDMKVLSAVINGDASTTVTTRAGHKVPTLAKALADISKGE
jgi:uncharacterized protein with PIN domain